MAIRSQTQRALLFAFIASIAGCGLCGIYVLIIGNFGKLEGKVLASTASVGGAAILALAAAIPWEKRRWPPIGLLGLLAAATALVLMLILIWTMVWRIELYVKSLLTACVLAVALPHIGLLSLARLGRGYEWIRYGTVVAIAALAALLMFMIWSETTTDELFRLVGVLAILDACGTIATPVLHRVSAIRTREAVQTVELQVTLTCPRCSKTQTLEVGRSKCANCGLRFRIEIEEEHCPKCGYALYRLTSAVCPECGTPIAHATPSPS
jgi:ribosomal protein L37E